MNGNNTGLESLTNWEKFDALTDKQVMAAALSDPEAQPVTEAEFINYRQFPQLPGSNFLDRVRAVKENKTSLTVRYDTDVVRFFKEQGRGYQRLMNNVLRAYMEASTHPQRPQESRQAEIH